MEPKFWQERWARNQIGFHLPEVNPYLLRHWPTLGWLTEPRCWCRCVAKAWI